jgi:hypothetical protein
MITFVFLAFALSNATDVLTDGSYHASTICGGESGDDGRVVFAAFVSSKVLITDRLSELFPFFFALQPLRS